MLPLRLQLIYEEKSLQRGVHHAIEHVKCVTAIRQTGSVRVHGQGQGVRPPGQDFLSRDIVDDVPCGFAGIAIRLQGQEEIVRAHRFLVVVAGVRVLGI